MRMRYGLFVHLESKISSSRFRVQDHFHLCIHLALHCIVRRGIGLVESA